MLRAARAVAMLAKRDALVKSLIIGISIIYLINLLDSASSSQFLDQLKPVLGFLVRKSFTPRCFGRVALPGHAGSA